MKKFFLDVMKRNTENKFKNLKNAENDTKMCAIN